MNCPYCGEPATSMRISGDDGIDYCRDCEIVLEGCDCPSPKDDREDPRRVVAAVAKGSKIRYDERMKYARGYDDS